MTVKYRRPYATEWEDIPLETGDGHGCRSRVGEPAANASSRSRIGEKVMHTKAIAHLGGATLDNEENYLIKKLSAGGLGMVCISNQARI